MVEDGPLSDRRRALEEDYFRNKDKQIVEKMRREQALVDDRAAIAAATGLTDDALIADLQSAGFTADTIVLLNLVPAIEVAWAEAPVPKAERNVILSAAQLQGVQDGSAAARQLDAWLSSPPPKATFAAALRAIHAIIDRMPAEAAAQARESVLELTSAVARGAGGLLGFGAVSGEERKVIERLAALLNPTK
jgi:hypothetical protein